MNMIIQRQKLQKIQLNVLQPNSQIMRTHRDNSSLVRVTVDPGVH